MRYSCKKKGFIEFTVTEFLTPIEVSIFTEKGFSSTFRLKKKYSQPQVITFIEVPIFTEILTFI